MVGRSSRATCSSISSRMSWSRRRQSGSASAVTDADVQTEIDSIITSYYGGDQEKFNTDLTTNNMTLDQLKQNYRESMLMQKVYENVDGQRHHGS